MYDGHASVNLPFSNSLKCSLDSFEVLLFLSVKNFTSCQFYLCVLGDFIASKFHCLCVSGDFKAYAEEKPEIAKLFTTYLDMTAATNGHAIVDTGEDGDHRSNVDLIKNSPGDNGIHKGDGKLKSE